MAATYTKGSSGDTWAFQGAMTVGGTLGVTGAQTFSSTIALGTISDAGGLTLTDTTTRGVGLFTELPSTGTAISAGKVIYGVESRLVINKDQTTTNDTSIYALSGHLRVKQDLPQSSSFGLFGYFEQSGTSTAPFGGAFRAKVEGEAGLTTTKLYGILVDGHVASGATVSTEYAGIRIATDIEGSGGQKAWTYGLLLDATATTGISITSTSTTAVALYSSGTPMTVTDSTYAVVKAYATSPSTHASNSVQPFLFNTVMSGAGGVGGRMRVNMETDVALGGWANALKASVDLKTSGGATGLLSVSCHELTMAGSAGVNGTYTILETELVCPASWTNTSPVSVLYFNATGATAANFDTYGYLFDINGVTSAENKIFFINATAAVAASLRIKVNGTPYYIMLATDQTA